MQPQPIATSVPPAPAPMPEPVPAPAPAPAPTPMYTPPAPPAPPAPVGGEGGDGSFAEGGPVSGIKAFFSDINWVEVLILGVAGGYLLWSIYKTKEMMTMQKVGYNDLNGRLAKLEAAEAQRKAEAMANATGKNKRRPVLRIA